jgi:hypothetical protein
VKQNTNQTDFQLERGGDARRRFTNSPSLAILKNPEMGILQVLYILGGILLVSTLFSNNGLVPRLHTIEITAQIYVDSGADAKLFLGNAIEYTPETALTELFSFVMVRAVYVLVYMDLTIYGFCIIIIALPKNFDNPIWHETRCVRIRWSDLVIFLILVRSLSETVMIVLTLMIGGIQNIFILSYHATWAFVNAFSFWFSLETNVENVSWYVVSLSRFVQLITITLYFSGTIHTNTPAGWHNGLTQLVGLPLFIVLGVMFLYCLVIFIKPLLSVYGFVLLDSLVYYLLIMTASSPNNNKLGVR